MEFNEKLQELRRRKGITQEELANALFVSRTAVSKWESGRGYPSIESLKTIADFFEITIDEPLSSNEIINLAEETQQNHRRVFDLLFGLLDIGVAILFFLPFFAQKAGDAINEVSLLSLTDISSYLKNAYLLLVILITLFGVLTLAMQGCANKFWNKTKTKISLSLNSVGVLLFIASLQPYAATFLLVFLAIKILLFIKRQ